MPVSVYYKIRKRLDDDPKVDKGQAKRSINNCVGNRAMCIGGKAKAMLVTSSRLHAVRYKLAIYKYIREKGYNIKALVAFSGTVNDDGDEYTEVAMNKEVEPDITESNLPNIFDKDEFKILIVAEKYQTGFDQPKLCAMYVDKKLDGVKTVQTLSRLNRTYHDKQTFILDFQNSVEDIQAAYESYFEMTNIDKVTDPNVVNDLWYQLHEYGIYHDEEVNEFATLFYKEQRTAAQDGKMNNIIDKGEERYCFIEAEDEERADEFKKKAQKYITFYNFLLQIYPLKNLNLLRLQVYLVALLKKLSKKGKERVNLDDLLTLDYYKLKKLGKDEKRGANISLTYGEGELVGISENAQSRIGEGQEDYLDDIIQRINDVFGIGLTEEDRIMIDQYEEVFVHNKSIMDIAKVNSYKDLVNTFAKSYFKRGIVKTKNRNDRFVKEILTNQNFQNFMIHYFAEKIYDEANRK